MTGTGAAEEALPAEAAQHGGPQAARTGGQVQGPAVGGQPGAGGPHARLHEPAGDGVQHVRAHAQAQVVRLDRRLLLLHQLRQLAQLRGHQADDEQLHALHLGRGHVLPAEPAAHVPSVVTPGRRRGGGGAAPWKTRRSGPQHAAFQPN